ncbi:MAG: hypothetical protein SCM11_14595 [Bacillota bacterium]|nr:hypothetical protein [Bacillota bacterium]
MSGINTRKFAGTKVHTLQADFESYMSLNDNIYNSQIILHAQESLSEIYAVKKIYINIIMGRIILQIDDQDEKNYSPSDVIEIPGRTRMKIKNRSSYKSAILVMKS